MKNWKITKTQIERIVIECPMSEAKSAIEYIHENGYKGSGWSGPALNKKKSGPTYLDDIYHAEGEKEI